MPKRKSGAGSDGSKAKLGKVKDESDAAELERIYGPQSKLFEKWWLFGRTVVAFRLRCRVAQYQTE